MDKRAKKPRLSAAVRAIVLGVVPHSEDINNKQYYWNQVPKGVFKSIRYRTGTHGILQGPDDWVLVANSYMNRKRDQLKKCRKLIIKSIKSINSRGCGSDQAILAMTKRKADSTSTLGAGR
uniref:uncharacterized protein LOC120334412 n=1 Tax=Styela clava TaxID=7725 RepID=UPI00193A854B|nr:uncharacterized protein LOC120334412 [Styela clava]